MKRIFYLLFMALAMLFVTSPVSADNAKVERVGDSVIIRDGDGNVIEITDLGGGSTMIWCYNSSGNLVYYAYQTDSDNSTNNVWFNGQYYNAGQTPNGVDRFYYYSPFDGKTHMVEDFKVKNPKGKNTCIITYPRD